MKLETNSTDRKALAKQIGEMIQEQPHYDGPPSFAYSVGPVTIDRQGMIETEDADAWAQLTPFFQEQGWLAPKPEVDSEAMQALADYVTRVDITVPADEVTPAQVKNFCRMMYSKQALLNLAYGQDIVRIWPQDLENIEAEETLDGIAWVMQGAFENGTLDGFRFQNGEFTMTFPHTASDPETWKLYSEFMNGVIRTAKTAARVKKEATIPEGNGKYLMHTWLLRMGFGGADFKALRKLLTDKLDGCCAFPDKERADKHKAKYAEIRKIKREINAEADGND